MDSFIHADVFFFITSIAVIMVTAFSVAALIYLVRILRDFNKISSKVKDETELIADDINQLRRKTKAGGLRLANFLSFLRKAGRGNKKGKK